MQFRLFLALSIGGVFMAHAQEPSREPLACEIAATETGRQVEFQGLVAASSALSGRYRLEIEKSGPSGSVTSRQIGNFTAEPARSLPVGRMVISVEPGASYEAALTIEAGGRSYECQKQGSGRAQ
jgi:hypothetical protein